MTSDPRAVPSSVNSWNQAFLEQQYGVYLSEPERLDPETRAFFQGFDLAMAGDLALIDGPTSSNGTPAAAATPGRAPGSGPARITPGAGQPAGRASHFQAVVDDLITAYRDNGHLAAKIDPFGRERPGADTLTLAYHQLTDADLSRPVDATSLGFAGDAPLRDVIGRLEQVYCGTIGVEFMHIQDTEQRAWLFERFESCSGRLDLDRGKRAHLLELLTKAELFESFLGKRYPGEKRFSLEGAETLIPLLDHLLETATELDVEEVVLGMAHRGRLTVLNTIMGKTYEQIFTEFEDVRPDDFSDGGGDVKYHQGYSGTRRFPSGRMLHLSMASNPSHLEAVDGVVQGRCRAKQRLRGDAERSRVIPVLIHGDAAIAGQGVVAEVLNYSKLEGYTTGGTVHVVVNNQIGFTTLPEDSRTSRYCTDVGKMIDAPIFHVNAEDPEAVVSVAQFAMEYRQQFKRDVFIDLVCYRRYGHNEQDEASFTQPVMARMIREKKPVLQGYARHLQDEGVIQDSDQKAIAGRIAETLEKAQRAVKDAPETPAIDPGSARWSGLNHEYSFDRVDTGVTKEVLAEVCEALGRVPDGFNVNPKLKRVLKARSALPESGEISYADAEALAFGTLLVEGHPIRVSGQDSRRGTFSHRHAVIRDAKSGEPYVPLNNIRDLEAGEQANLCVYDSPLSEASVLAFDYGYSLADPNMLVCWEAQFGDFVNGAQVIIDQFIASAEAKWDRWSGLVMLLPHGYEGMGPEHSSARLERFLKLCGGDNIQVVYPSTAAQTFHMFRRQLKRDFRKPLIVMTPKSMLRVPTGHITELSAGGFEEILDDPHFAKGEADRKGVKRVILCCGKLFWELDQRRNELARDDVALIRIEQVYPFHRDRLREVLNAYPAGAEMCYAQEEPYNAAAYLFVNNKCENELGLDRLRYFGRPASGSPATGSKKQHKVEQEAILTEAIGPKPDQPQDDKQSLAASV